MPRGARPALGCLALAATFSACQQSAQGRQLDINFATPSGIGSMTTAPVKLPHGRYTFFSSADPPTCVTSVVLLDHGGHLVADDTAGRSGALSQAPGAPPDVKVTVNLQMVPTMVQQELPSGSYRLKVTASGAGCAWQVEEILNYMLSNETPLTPMVLPSAPVLDVLLGNTSTDRHFHVDAPGIYKVDWNVTPCDTYSGDLVRSDGGTIHLGDGRGVSVQPGGGFVGPQGTSMPTFLGSGDWTARVSTRCFWQIAIV